MFGKAIWLIVIYFLAKEIVPAIASIIVEALYYGTMRCHSPATQRLKERKAELEEREKERRRREESHDEQPMKRPIGFNSNSIES